MSTLRLDRTYNPLDPHNFYDCMGESIVLANGEELELEPDEYHCPNGAKGTGTACIRCEMRWAYWLLEKSEEALKAAGSAHRVWQIMPMKGAS